MILPWNCATLFDFWITNKIVLLLVTCGILPIKAAARFREKGAPADCIHHFRPACSTGVTSNGVTSLMIGQRYIKRSRASFKINFCANLFCCSLKWLRVQEMKPISSSQGRHLTQKMFFRLCHSENPSTWLMYIFKAAQTALMRLLVVSPQFIFRKTPRYISVCPIT